MPIIKPQIAKIDQREALRYAGLQTKADWRPDLLERACRELLLVAEPRLIYNILPHASGQIGEYMYPGLGLKNHLQNCSQGVVFAGTLGAAVDEKISQLFEQGEYTLGLLFNGAATALIEQAADALSSLLVRSTFGKQGLRLGWRFSPGYGDWPLEEQRNFFPLTGGEQIGIQLTDSCSLNPKKSITAVMPVLNNESTRKTCEECGQKNCAYRKN